MCTACRTRTNPSRAGIAQSVAARVKCPDGRFLHADAALGQRRHLWRWLRLLLRVGTETELAVDDGHYSRAILVPGHKAHAPGNGCGVRPRSSLLGH